MIADSYRQADAAVSGLASAIAALDSDAVTDCRERLIRALAAAIEASDCPRHPELREAVDGLAVGCSRAEGDNG